MDPKNSGSSSAPNRADPTGQSGSIVTSGDNTRPVVPPIVTSGDNTRPVVPPLVPTGISTVVSTTVTPPGVVRQTDRKRSLQAGEGSSNVRRPPQPVPQQQPVIQPQPQPQQGNQQPQGAVPPPPPPPPAVPAPVRYECIICHRDFPSAKGLFGHMRSHPERGWRGVFPPPSFNRDEFADVVDQTTLAEDAGNNNNNNQAAQQPRIIPDLNNSPPPEEDGQP